MSNRTQHPLRHRAARAVLALALVGSVTGRAAAQAGSAGEARTLPFAVGEELTYRATLSGIRVGTARMHVAGVDTVRGRAAYHLVFALDARLLGFRVRDRYESWVDTLTLASLRYRQDISEGRYKRQSTYEIYPERAEYQKAGDSVRASVADPLDDGSFIYAVRTAAVAVGETRRLDRYFKPDRNPVTLTGLGRDTLTVGAGTFATVRVRPTIRTRGLFAEDGEAEVWFSDDARRYPVQVRARVSRFALRLTLDAVVVGGGERPSIAAISR